MTDLRTFGSAHLIQVRNINREMLEKALQLRCAAYLADIKAALLVQTVTSIGESKRFVSGANVRLRDALAQVEHEIELRRQAEAELRRITGAVDRAPIGVALFVDGQRIYANEFVTTRFGVEACPRCVDDQDDQRLRRAVVAGEALLDELELVSTGGSLWGRVRVSPDLDDGAGQIVGLFIEDVDKEREVAEQLRRSHRLEAIGQLTGGIAHDFNNALGVILANAELLLEGDARLADPRVPLRTIIESVRHASALTRQLLAFGRRSTLRPVPVDVAALIEKLASMLRRTLGEAFPLQLDLGQRSSLVLCDPAALEAALLNLVLNARDASAPSGPITLALSPWRCSGVEQPQGLLFGGPLAPGLYLRISVGDEGSGIGPELLERIWEPFVSTKDADHSGMGLSMVFGFVSQSGGAIELETKLGVGTTMHMLLPRVDDPAEREHEHGTRLCVLVVEDERLLRQSIAAVLEHLGYQVLTAQTYAEATALIEEQAIACLISDLVLDGSHTGIDVAARARARWPQLPVVFVSGYQRDVLGERELPAGAEFLAKPFSRDDLDTLLSRLLSRQ